MQKIVPNLWFDHEAVEAATFYTTVFDNSKINWKTVIKDTPSGDSEQISFTLEGLDIFAISAGPIFTLNPTGSFSVFCETEEEVEDLWEQLIAGGTVIMALDRYPFSNRYGWVKDRFGLSWQLMHVDYPFKQKIYPTLTFVGKQYLKAEEARAHYVSIFKEAKMGDIFYYGEEAEDENPKAVSYSSFTLEGVTHLAMDMMTSDDSYFFNEAFSLMVSCEDQAEIDYYWEKLSTVPEAEECGWLKDKFGISWQIMPREMDEMMQSTDEEAKARVVEAFLKMKKIDIAALNAAYAGEVVE